MKGLLSVISVRHEAITEFMEKVYNSTYRSYKSHHSTSTNAIASSYATLTTILMLSAIMYVLAEAHEKGADLAKSGIDFPPEISKLLNEFNLN